MAAAQGSRWSCAAEGMKEINIALHNAELRIYRTDAAEVEVYVENDQEIDAVVQVERSDGGLSIVQKRSGRRWHATRGFDVADTINVTVREALGDAFGHLENIMEEFGVDVSDLSRGERSSHGNSVVDRVAVGIPASVELPSVSARLERGEIEVADVRGDLTLRSGRGTIKLSRCGRICAATTGSGDITAHQCEGDLDLHTGTGAIVLSACQGSARVRSGKGTIRLEECHLEGSCHTGQGDLWLASVTGSGGTYHTGSGTITVAQPQADSLELHTGMGDILVRAGDVEALRASSGAGNLRIIDLQRVGRLEAHTGMGDITASGGRVDVLNMRVGAGNLSCSMILSSGEHTLETGAGNIDVHLPDTARVRVDAVTRMGGVHSDFRLIKVGRPGPVTSGSGRFVGSIGDGEATATLHLKTSAGHIAIRRTAVPQTGEKTASHVSGEATTSAGIAPSNSSPAQIRLEVLQSLQRGEISVEEAIVLLERNV